MASFVIDSDMFKDQYGTPEMRAVFSDEQLMQNWLNAWVALAEAETELGIVPKEAAEHIRECAKWENMNMDEVRNGFFTTSHPLMPQIRGFEKVCGKKAGGYIHWGGNNPGYHGYGRSTANQGRSQDTDIPGKGAAGALSETGKGEPESGYGRQDPRTARSPHYIGI